MTAIERLWEKRQVQLNQLPYSGETIRSLKLKITALWDAIDQEYKKEQSKHATDDEMDFPSGLECDKKYKTPAIEVTQGETITIAKCILPEESIAGCDFQYDNLLVRGNLCNYEAECCHKEVIVMQEVNCHAGDKINASSPKT